MPSSLLTRRSRRAPLDTETGWRTWLDSGYWPTPAGAPPGESDSHEPMPSRRMDRRLRPASNEPLADQVRRFCENLERDDRCQEWQVCQAQQALRIYVVNLINAPLLRLSRSIGNRSGKWPSARGVPSRRGDAHSARFSSVNSRCQGSRMAAGVPFPEFRRYDAGSHPWLVVRADGGSVFPLGS